MKKQKQAYHYYAATAYGWAVAPTRNAALRAVAADVGSTIINRACKVDGGLAGKVCRVELPQAAHYTISEYLPSKITKEDSTNTERAGEPVPLSEVESVRITSVSGSTVPRLLADLDDADGDC